MAGAFREACFAQCQVTRCSHKVAGVSASLLFMAIKCVSCGVFPDGLYQFDEVPFDS